MMKRQDGVQYRTQGKKLLIKTIKRTRFSDSSGMPSYDPTPDFSQTYKMFWRTFAEII